MKKLFVFVILSVSLFAASACSGLISTQPGNSDSTAIPTVAVSPAATITPPVVPTSAPSSTPEGTGNPILNRPWKWVRTEMSSGDIISPIKQDAFTITFGEDGNVTGTTDCNNFFGTFTMQDGLLSFGELASTKMYCEGSQETDFLRGLGEVQSFLIVDNQLVLELKYGSGQVIFE